MRTVVFDLDGTLADTSGDLLAAANAALSDAGHSARLDPARHSGLAMRGGRAMLTEALGAGHPDVEVLYQPLLDAYRAAICRFTKLYPGAMETVSKLSGAGHPVAICTNKPEGLARALLTELDVLNAFDALIGADTLPTRKPDPAPLHEAVARAGGRQGHAVMIGDTQTDRDTARAAGIPCVLVAFGPHGDAVADLEPDAILNRYADLHDVIESL